MARLLLVLLCAAAPLIGGDDEIVREFKKYFRKYKDTATRVEAVLALEGTETASVVEVLRPVLKDPDPEVARAAATVLASFEAQAPIDAVLAALANEKNEAVRLGLLDVVAAGGYEGATDALLSCLTDRSWPVRQRGIRALAATKEVLAVEAIAPLAGDKEVAVRSAALDGLAELGAAEVVALAIPALQDESWQVRASAMAALGRVRRKEAIEPLITSLESEQGRLKTDAARALSEIVGRDFGERAELWRRFWESNRERYEIPTDEELAKLKKKRAETAAKYERTDAVSFGGIETPSRSIVFVIDVSGSMEQLVADKEAFEGGDYPSLMRMDVVKTELARTIERLEPYVKFNVLAFATDVRAWKKKLVSANVLNKSSALSWVARLEAIGGASKEDLATAGLTSAANLEGGKTNTYDALMIALGAPDERSRKDYEVDVDTIFFLSDGKPSHGPYTIPEDILREVREVNELRKVVIHVISIGEVHMEFMRQLALENGGEFVHLGR